MSTLEGPFTRDAQQQTLEVAQDAQQGPWTLEVGSPHGGGAHALAGSVVVGSGSHADLCLEDPTVSSRHCSVSVTPRGVVVEDLGSRNGTFVGGARVARALLPGAHASFVVGRTTLVVRAASSEEPSSNARVPGLCGSSAPIRRVAESVRRFAPLRCPVLLLGESGTGKDVVAQALHRLSKRSGQLVPLNVGAITESLADSELFGHRRGAFTGAIAARPGAFELAQYGTLFLDEIADLPASLQVKLLRVVEDGMVRSVGATQMTKVDVRLVSATWASLDERVARGSFRSDLLHRLSTVVIRLPPLRQRVSDIPELCRVLLARHSAELGDKRVSSAALARLVDHSWPGNVRELASVLYRGAVAAQGEIIDAVHVELPTSTGHRARPEPLSPVEALALLQRCRGNTTEAARAARVPRSTFRSWLQKARNGTSADGSADRAPLRSDRRG